MPLVSVIVPAFNAEQTLAATLDSLRRQTIRDAEILVVDDGSTDATPTVAEAFPDPRVRVISGANGGLATARNRGVACAAGRYVSFLDADDLWTPDKLESQIHALRSRPGRAVAYSWTAIVDGQGQFLFAKAPSRHEGLVHRSLLVDLFIGSGSNVMFDRERLSIDLRFDESLRVAEDWDFLLRLAREHQFAVIPRYQVLYRLVSGSLSSRVQEMEASLLRSAEREFAASAPALDGLRPQSIAMIRRFVATQSLLRVPPPLDVPFAAGKLAAAVRSSPRSAADLRTWLLAGALALLAVTPARHQPSITVSMLHLYGRLQRVALPAIRRSLAPAPPAQ